MLRFFLERSFQAISARRLWLLLAVVPPAVYLVVSAAVPDRFVVRQEVSLSGNDLIALSPKPGDLKAVNELVSSPRYFFLNKFALVLLGKQLVMNMEGEKEVENCLTLATAGDRTVITYDGSDRRRGRVMVAFYAQRLIQQAGDWLKKKPKRARQKRSRAETVGQDHHFRALLSLARETSVAGGNPFFRVFAHHRSGRCPGGMVYALLQVGAPHGGLPGSPDSWNVAGF